MSFSSKVPWHFRDYELQYHLHLLQNNPSVNPTEQISIPLITPEEKAKIRKQLYKEIHVGLVIIGVQGLHNSGQGAKTLVCLYDQRITNLKQSIIGSFEINMNEKGAIVYFIPDFVMNTKEMLENIKLGIKTIGYNMVLGSKNLRVTTGFIGKMQEHSNVKYKLNTNELEKIMMSKGVKALPGIKIDSLVNAGKEWELEDLK